MSPDRDSRFPDDPDDDYEADEPRRSIFSAAWFRVLIVLLGIGVVGAVAVPYVLDVVQPPAEAPRIATPPPPPPAPSQGGARPGGAPAAPAPPPPPSTAMPATPPAAPVTSPPAAPPPAAAEPKVAATRPTKSAPAERVKTPEASPRPAEPRVAAAQKSALARPKAAAAGGEWFVQVGAFKEQETARRVATRLRDQNYPVEESVKRAGGAAAPAPRPAPAPRASSAPAGPDRYDVLVSGGAAADINSKLAGKGLASEPAAEGVRIRPSLPLRDAVALSKDLGAEGFKVQVRRAGGASPEPAPAPAAARPAGGGDGLTLYRVRVGGYPDRATAQGVARELTDKGFQPFLAKGRE